MRDASASCTTDWAHRFLASFSKYFGAGGPAKLARPTHDQEGLYGIALVLDGVIEVEAFSFTLEPQLELVSRAVLTLRPGDHGALSHSDYAHRRRSPDLASLRALVAYPRWRCRRIFGFDRDAEGCWGSVEHRVCRDAAFA